MFAGYGFVSVGGSTYQGVASTPRCNGRGYTFGTETLAGLQVARRVYVPSDDEFARLTTILTNATDAAVTVPVVFTGTMGAGANTAVTASSSGDATAGADDVWFATAGDFSAPRAGHVMGSEGARVSVESVTGAGAMGEVSWSYSISVPAGSKVVLLHFVTGQPTQADAAAKAAEISALPAATLTCLSADEINNTVNFAVSSDDADACLGVPEGSACSTTPGQCTEASGSCEAGLCVATPVSDGTACDDGIPGTDRDECSAGVCQGRQITHSNCSATGAGLPANPGGSLFLLLIALIGLAIRRVRIA